EIQGTVTMTGQVIGVNHLVVTGMAAFSQSIEVMTLEIPATGSVRLDAEAIVHTLATNLGTLTLGQSGHLNARADFITTGTLTIEEWSTQPDRYGRVTALGTGTIGGALNVVYAGPAVPRRGRVDLVSATRLNGSFSTITTPQAQGQQQFLVQQA